MAEGFGLSGIVSILFCGMTMNYYTRFNLHDETARFNEQFFKVLASTCETFVFIYIGLGVCFFRHTYRWPLIGTSLAALFIARAGARTHYVDTVCQMTVMHGWWCSQRVWDQLYPQQVEHSARTTASIKIYGCVYN